MRVLIVNTSERKGGAAVAAWRLTEALNKNGVKTTMLVRDKETNEIAVADTGGGWTERLWFLWERLVIFFHLKWRRDGLFGIDIANAGIDITRLREFREADIIHLHWINQGMLSLQTLRKILRSGKPVVWTMHDAWPSTAICHYTRGCGRYKTRCAECPLLPDGGSKTDLSAKVWARKQLALSEGLIYFVTCSRWLEGVARQSALLKSHKITSIPNTIDTRIYRPMEQATARQKAGLPLEGRIILFVSQRVTDERKGMRYFIEAISQLAEAHPDWSESVSVAVLGGSADEVAEQLPLKVHALGYISHEESIVSIYNAADVFVIPSLEDNLPNTIMEAMACGVPSVGFKVGGIPEMIDHEKNGYVAEPRSSSDLARGIEWALGSEREELAHACLRKVNHNYSQSAVAMRYIEVYNEAIAMKQFRL